MAEINFEKMAEGFVKSLRQRGFFVSRWIPVSEGLPEEDVDVLITYKYSGKKIVTMAHKQSSDGWRFENDGWIPDKLVIALMPLPEPMKEGEENC